MSSGIFCLFGRDYKPIETIVLTLFGLRTEKSTAELQSPSTSAPISPSSLKITLPERYLVTFLFIIIFIVRTLDCEIDKNDQKF